MVSNELQIKIQVENTRICRRTKPEIAINIGRWMTCLEALGQVNVVSNTVLLFFTHRNFKKIFLESEETNEFQFNSIGWEALYFLMFLMAIEHMVFGFRLLIKYYSNSEPDSIRQGELERSKLIKKFE